MSCACPCGSTSNLRRTSSSVYGNSDFHSKYAFSGAPTPA